MVEAIKKHLRQEKLAWARKEKSCGCVCKKLETVAATLSVRRQMILTSVVIIIKCWSDPHCHYLYKKGDFLKKDTFAFAQPDRIVSLCA